MTPRRRCDTLSFLRRGVSGAVGVRAWLFRLDGVEGGDLKKGEESMYEVGCPEDMFEAPRPLGGVVG